MDVEQNSRVHEDITTQRADTSILVEAVMEINKVTKRQYNKAVMEEEKVVEPQNKLQNEVLNKIKPNVLKTKRQ